MKLQAKPGVRGICIGGIEYLVDSRGMLELPNEHVDSALKNGFDLPSQPQTEAQKLKE